MIEYCLILHIFGVLAGVVHILLQSAHTVADAPQCVSQNTDTWHNLHRVVEADASVCGAAGFRLPPERNLGSALPSPVQSAWFVHRRGAAGLFGARSGTAQQVRPGIQHRQLTLMCPNQVRWQFGGAQSGDAQDSAPLRPVVGSQVGECEPGVSVGAAAARQ